MDHIFLAKISPFIRNSILLDIEHNRFKAIFCKTQTTEISQNFTNFEINQSVHKLLLNTQFNIFFQSFRIQHHHSNWLKWKNLFIEPFSNYQYIVDTACSISLFPFKNNYESTRSNITNSFISTFDTFTTTINIANQYFTWTFLLAEIDHIIIGADFLSYYNFKLSSH